MDRALKSRFLDMYKKNPKTPFFIDPSPKVPKSGPFTSRRHRRPPVKHTKVGNTSSDPSTISFSSPFPFFPKSIHPKSKSFSSLRDNRLLRHFPKTQKLISRGSVQCSRCRVTTAGKGIQRALQRCLP